MWKLLYSIFCPTHEHLARKEVTMSRLSIGHKLLIWTIGIALVALLGYCAMMAPKPARAQSNYSFEVEWYTDTVYATLWSLPEQVVTTTVFSSDVVSDFISLADSIDGIRIPYPNVSFPYEPQEFWFTEETGKMGGSRHLMECPVKVSVTRDQDGSTLAQIFNKNDQPLFVEDDQGSWRIIEASKTYDYATTRQHVSILIKTAPYVTAPECATVWWAWSTEISNGPIINEVAPKAEAAVSETVVITGQGFTNDTFTLPEHMLIMEFEDQSVQVLTDRHMTTTIEGWTNTQITFEVQPEFVVDLEGCLRVVVGNRQSNCVAYAFYKDEIDPVPSPDKRLFLPVACFSK